MYKYSEIIAYIEIIDLKYINDFIEQFLFIFFQFEQKQ